MDDEPLGDRGRQRRSSLKCCRRWVISTSAMSGLSARVIYEGHRCDARILALLDGAGPSCSPELEPARKVVEGLTSYLAKRLAMAVFTIYIVISLSFFMVRLMPGNAIEYLEAQMTIQGGLSPEEIQQKVRAIYGVLPSGPLWKQYLQYVGNAFHGNLGNSITNPGQSVGEHPRRSASLDGLHHIGRPHHQLRDRARHRHRHGRLPEDMVRQAHDRRGVLPLGHTQLSCRHCAALFLCRSARLVPPRRRDSVGLQPGLNWPFIQSALVHAVLPIATYVIVGFGGWALIMKGSVVTTLGADYVRAAEAWGLSSRRVTRSYIGRNSMLPMVTNLACLSVTCSGLRYSSRRI